jgi:hypothetical protein
MKISDFRLQPALMILWIQLAGFCFTSGISAQGLSKRHYLIDGNMAPGLAAQSFLIADPTLAHHIQPVRVTLPSTVSLEAGNPNGSYVATLPNATLGMMIGPVYRFRLSNIQDHPGKELYPSIELLGRLYPPAGMEHRFPVEIHLEQSDLELALQGSLVTKVIYLEDAELSFPQQHREGAQPTIDLSINEDPMRAAETLGRPMAIVRIGSRIPTFQANDQNFHFNAFAPTIIAVEGFEAGGWVPNNAPLQSIQ